MSGYKFYYFNVRAKGEICRLAFSATNIEFEDIRLQGEEWTKEKACKFKIETIRCIYNLPFCALNWLNSGVLSL